MGQQDQQSFVGRFPTTSWQAGAYGLRIGVYDENGSLPLADENKAAIQLLDLIQISTK